MAYTEIFKAASPLRGGFPAAAMGGGTFGFTAATGAGSGLVSTTLSSVNIVLLHTYNQTISGAFVLAISSNGMIDIAADAPCSGGWVAFGY